MAMFYFANWKMYQSFVSIKKFVQDYKKYGLSNPHNDTYLGIAASYEHLYFLQQKLQRTSVLLGAQDCSFFLQGAYTGQVALQSLQEMQVSFCIIGHSEARRYLGHTDQDIFLKFKMLVAAGISPILSIGETLQQKESGQTLQVLCDQLEQVLQFLQSYQGDLIIFIAYEPLYAIGTGIVPQEKELRDVFYCLHSMIQQLPAQQNIRFLYGGSVSQSTIVQLKNIKEISGFLIGKASIDFQELKKIVES